MDTIRLRDLVLASLVVVLGAVGTYLILPHRHVWTMPRRAHLIGAGLVALSILLLALFWTPPGPFLTSLFFYGFGLASVACGVLMVTSRNPVYSALWFAGVVLATSGLFLLAGAQFLAAGTVIVYAGAIIVTFLFVIMLAQSQGLAVYDRAARAPARATLCCFLLLWSLMYALLAGRSQTFPNSGTSHDPDRNRLVSATALLPLASGHAPAPRMELLQHALPTTTRMAAEGDPSAPHVAGLGGTLFTDHLIAAEVAGVLLFVALVGALAIAPPKPPKRPGARTGETSVLTVRE
jgi:NADH-quinone oxidoreductase subunit J